MKHPNVLIAETWLAEFNAKDLEKLLYLYHEEAKQYSPKPHSVLVLTKCRNQAMTT